MAKTNSDLAQQIIVDKAKPIMEKTGIPGLSGAILNPNGSISPFFTGTVNSTLCGFLKQPQLPSEKEQQRFNKSYYILSEDGLFYFNKAENELKKIDLEKEKLTILARIFQPKEIDILSAEALQKITAITNHSHSSPSELVNADTVFGAASLSKPVFAYLVLKLIHAQKNKPTLGAFNKKFDLDTSLCEVFPDLLKKFRPEDWDKARQLTARMVLSHTTGLPITHEDSKGLISFQFGPGTHYGYSGPGIAYLQETLEHLTGTDLETLAREYVFTPCKMSEKSSFKGVGEEANAANSLRTTATDYAKFIWEWMNDPSLSYAFEPNNKFMMDAYLPDDWPVTVNVQDEDKKQVTWGLGLGMQGRKLYHSGDMGEWRAWVVADLDQKSAVIYFANSHNGHILAEQIISPHINLDAAFNYFFQTYGFARNVEELEGRTNFHGLQPSRVKPLKLDLLREQAKIPGVSVATLDALGKITTETAGVVNQETGQTVNKETVFEAASLSKPLFAYIVLKMAERGELDLDKPIYEQLGDYGPPLDSIRKPEEFYPDHKFADNYKKLTPRMILSHQAGLPNEFNPKKPKTFRFISPIGKKFDYSGESYRFLQELVDHLKPGYELASLPVDGPLAKGKLYVSYGSEGLDYKIINPLGEAITAKMTPDQLKQILNQNDLTKLEPFSLQKLQPFLPKILQETTERGHTLPSLEVLAQKEFANPNLGLKHSSFLPPHASKNQAVGHLADGTVDTNRHFYGIHPAASLHTTAEDYAKFLKACVTDPYIKKEMFSPVPGVTTLSKKDSTAIKAGVSDSTLQQIGWGVGIGLQNNEDGSSVAFHWGDNKSGRNFAAINLSTHQATVCLTNSANGPAIFKELSTPEKMGADMSPTYDWLYTREGFNREDNPTLAYKTNLANIKEADSTGKTTTPNPFLK